MMDSKINNGKVRSIRTNKSKTKAALEAIKREAEDMAESMVYLASLQKKYYDALIYEGFEKDQAILLVSNHFSANKSEGQ